MMDKHEQPKMKAPRLLGSTRLALALVGFFGCVVIYALRSDVSFAIVCMVNGTAVEQMTGSNNETKVSSCHTSSDSDAVEKEVVCLSYSKLRGSH
ncbi:unnamed protein product [Toxocara canis]|uniref:Transmembrane protein n=1 Tax=Toxocara canis TaxID=6265 RepID=A0A183VFK7_TOXCA|nr:unnamed protein product [Toxocara canis]